MSVEPKASVEFFTNSIMCRGSWRVDDVSNIISKLSDVTAVTGSNITVDCRYISSFDSAGAWLLLKMIRVLKARATVNIQGLSPSFEPLLEGVTDYKIEDFQTPTIPSYGVLHQVGEESVAKTQHLRAFVHFIGYFSVELWQLLLEPVRLKIKHVLSIVDETGVRAMPIVALLTFLIGVVLAYQMGLQLKMYGANIYIVTLSGMAILREFSPLITAIIVAGRTSSAFAALIGMMVVNQEIDALRTMGVSSIERLVVPRVIGLMIAMPLLTFWADIFGILGSMVMAKSMLDIDYVDYVSRLRKTIELQTYMIGLIKAPVFALIVSLVGCFQGFQVSGDADSVGRQTTKAVVQAIFLIIIADAIFSVTFSWQGI